MEDVLERNMRKVHKTAINKASALTPAGTENINFYTGYYVAGSGFWMWKNWRRCSCS